jgi:hypothetical protein
VTSGQNPAKSGQALNLHEHIQSPSHGLPVFPSVLKEDETAKFGEYSTRRLGLEAWDRLS